MQTLLFGKYQTTEERMLVSRSPLQHELSPALAVEQIAQLSATVRQALTSPAFQRGRTACCLAASACRQTTAPYDQGLDHHALSAVKHTYCCQATSANGRCRPCDFLTQSNVKETHICKQWSATQHRNSEAVVHLVVSDGRKPDRARRHSAHLQLHPGTKGCVLDGSSCRSYVHDPPANIRRGLHE